MRHRSRVGSGAPAAGLDADPPVVRGWGPAPHVMPLSHRMVVAGLAIILMFAGYAQCGSVPDPTGPREDAVEVSR